MDYNHFCTSVTLPQKMLFEESWALKSPPFSFLLNTKLTYNNCNTCCPSILNVIHFHLVAFTNNKAQKKSVESSLKNDRKLPKKCGNQHKMVENWTKLTKVTKHYNVYIHKNMVNDFSCSTKTKQNENLVKTSMCVSFTKQWTFWTQNFGVCIPFVMSNNMTPNFVDAKLRTKIVFHAPFVHNVKIWCHDKHYG
jgi:hypothetical protein